MLGHCGQWMMTLTAVCLACVSSVAFAGTKVTVGVQVPPGQRVSMDQIDHAAWDRLLRAYVDDRGNVDYAGWKRSPEARGMLERYLQQLSHADPSRPAQRPAQLAFWINAYNALTVYGILREYPTTSIRNHTARLFGYNIWKDLLLYVGGQPYSLDTIEHQILRKMGEPRIHFAIVCASRSCPPLRNEAYTAERLDEQLSDNARRFFASPVGFRYVPAERTMYVTSILKWFGEDFGAGQAEQLRRIAPFLPTEAARQAALRGDVNVAYLDYDWSLNDQATIRRASR